MYSIVHNNSDSIVDGEIMGRSSSGIVDSAVLHDEDNIPDADDER